MDGAGERTREARLTQGSVPKGLLRLAGPMTVGILAILMMNTVDTLFVGQLGGPELAAMSFTFPVVALIGAVSLGLGVGATSLIANAIGAGDSERVRRLTTDALLLGLVVVGVLATAGLLTIDPLFRLLGASDANLPRIREYMSIWYFGTLFLVVPMISNAALRATGDARTPMMVMIAAALVNAAVDPLLIFGLGPFPRMELAGAAIATVFARAMTLVVSLWFVVRRERMLDLRPPRLRALLASWRSLLAIGLPAAATNVTVPVTAGILTRLVATYGDAAVAGFGVGTRVEMLAAIPAMALGSSVGPFVGQNWGAGRRDRVAQALRFVGTIAFVMGWIAVAILWPLSGAIAQLFNDEAAIVATASLYLSVVPLGYAFQNLVRTATSAYNAVGRPLVAAGLTALGTPVLVVPFAWGGSAIAGLEGLFAGLALVMAVTGTVSWRVLRPLRTPRDGDDAGADSTASTTTATSTSTSTKEEIPWTETTV